MNGWTDLQADLSEPVAAHLVYMNLDSHGHSFNIQCDISILLKGIENCKSRVVATLIVPMAKRPEERREPLERQWRRRTWREKGKRVNWVGRR